MDPGALVVLASGALMALIGGGDSEPAVTGSGAASAESARADALRAQFPGGDRVPAIVVVTPDRRRHRCAPADLGRGASQGPPQVSDDGRAAVAAVPLDANCPGSRSTTRSSRCATRPLDGLPPDLRAEVTGGPAFGADIANSFSGANITLLAVTAAVVALLLIVTYRSPVLWLVPLAVIAFADRVAAVVGSAVADGGGHAARRLDVGHHQRAGVRRGHQLRAAADLALPRGTGPRPMTTAPRCASRCGRPDRRSSPATRPSCWPC